jgi:hypothetical protein
MNNFGLKLSFDAPCFPLIHGFLGIGETGAMLDTFVFPLSNFLKDILRKNKSIGVIPCYLFMFGNFFNFFRKCK